MSKDEQDGKKGKDEKLQEFIDLVIDGEDVNWQLDSADTTEISDELKLLRMVDNLSKAFTTKSAFNDSPEDTESDDMEPLTQYEGESLFEWGHLRAIEQIGEGAYGQVYRAYDTVLDREVALKLRHPSPKAEIVNNAAFIEEARRLAQVRHPNVLSVHGAEVFDERVGLWSDLLLGETLTVRLNNGGPLKQEEVISLALHLCQALTAVHKAGLIHGDIKTANVMIEPDGQIILMDFGAGSKTNAKNIRRIGQTVYGTPQVMAPELFFGASQTPACDMYSVGTLLFRLLLGRYPIEARTVQEIITCHENKSSTLLKENEHLTPKPLTQLVEQLLDTNPQNRPTAAQTSERLQWIIEAPRRRAKRLAIYSIIGALSIGFLACLFGFFHSRAAERETRLALQREETIKEFIFDTFRSASPMMEGKDLKVVEVLDNAAARLEIDFADQPTVRGALLFTLGDTFRQLSEHDKALALLEKSQSIWLDIVGPTGERYLSTQLAIIASKMDHRLIEDPETALRELLSLSNTHLGPNQYITVESTLRLGAYLSSQGKYAEAESLLNLGCSIHLNDPLRAHQLQNFALISLGNHYNSQGKYKKAQVALEKIIEGMGPNSQETPNTMAARSALAVSYVRQGNFAEAEDLFRYTLELSMAALGPKNKSLVAILGNLGNVLHEQGKSDDAIHYMKWGLDLNIEIRGENDPFTLTSMGNLANVVREKGNLAEAESLLTRAIASMHETLGAEHPQTLMYEYNLSELLNLLGQHHEAENLSRKTWEAQKIVMGENHHFTLESHDMLGVSLKHLGQLEQAEQIHRQVWHEKTQLLGSDNPYTLLTQNNLAEVLFARHKHEEAESIYRDVLQLRTESLGPDHPETLKSMLGLIETLRAGNKIEEADQLQSAYKEIKVD